MAIEIFKIPLVNSPQKFDITLSGIQLTIITQWNQYMPAWSLSFFDKKTLEPLIVALPLVTGVDLLSQFAYLGIPGKLVVFTEGDELMPPTYENLGQESNLYYVVDDGNDE